MTNNFLDGNLTGLLKIALAYSILCILFTKKYKTAKIKKYKIL